MKLYKEPTIMTIAGVMAAFAVVGALFVDTDGRQDATVDTKVPLPLQVGSHKNPSISSSDANTDAQAGSDSSIAPAFQSSKSKSSSSSLKSTNLLGGR